MQTQQPQQGRICTFLTRKKFSRTLFCRAAHLDQQSSSLLFFFSPWTYHSRPLTFFLPNPSRMAGCCQTWAAKLRELWAMTVALTMMAHFSVAISLRVDFPEPLQDSTLRGKTNVISVMKLHCISPVVINVMQHTCRS